MLVEIKYIRKDEPKSLRKTRVASFIADSKDDGKAMFERWCHSEGIDYQVVMVMVVRDATQDTVTLDVKDVKQTQKGRVV